MKLGLDSYSYHLAFGAHADFLPARKISVFDFIERVAALQLDGFQIDPLHLESRHKTYLAEILAAANEKKLFLEYGTIGVDPQNLQQELEICQFLGSPVLRTFVGFDRYASRTDVAAEIQQAITNLNRVKTVAEVANIKIALENHGDVTTDELLQIVRTVDSPFVGICLDLGNPMLTLEAPLPAAEKMVPFAVTTHFKDYAVQLTNYGCKICGVALGDGNIDLLAAAGLFREKSTLDRLILEIPIEARGTESQALAFEDTCVRRSVAFARERLGVR
jgi:sugar phosphate isomerase/epimerase